MKTKLGYLTLGAILGIVGMVVGLSVPPVTAQNDRFGEITCTGLKVVDAEGNTRIHLLGGGGMVNVESGLVAVNGKAGHVWLSSENHTSFVRVSMARQQ